jgi:putative membrane protein
MITDHTRVGQQFQAIATALKLSIPTTLAPDDQAMVNRLKPLTGSAFDRAYMSQMVQDHTQAVALFSTEARNGQQPELKQFAATTLPALQEHLRLARTDAQAVGR